MYLHQLASDEASAIVPSFLARQTPRLSEACSVSYDDEVDVMDSLHWLSLKSLLEAAWLDRPIAVTLDAGRKRDETVALAVVLRSVLRAKPFREWANGTSRARPEA